MSDWNAEKYLQFKAQRTQPAIDLAKRVSDHSPQKIADIGCGPGNSTKILRETFPKASLIGIDSSETMINKAKTEYPELHFQICSAEQLSGTYDLLFSNACLQWIPDHTGLLPLLMTKLNRGGCLAVQIPMNQNEPLFRIIKEVAADSQWNFEHVSFEKNDVLSPEEYYQILSHCASQFDLWETVYYHTLPSHIHLIEWVRGTRLRPYLDVLNSTQQQQFEQALLSRVKSAYPLTQSGEVLLKFRRFFFIAYL